MDPQRELDSCRLCGFIFLDKRRKRNIVGDFAKIFESVVGVKILEGDKRGVCDTCRYRVEKSWKSGTAIQEQPLKRKHPISPLSSTKGDQDTERVILRKKPGHRLTFEHRDSSEPIPIRPNRTLAEALPTANEVSCKKSKPLRHCRQSSNKGTYVKVGTQQYNAPIIVKHEGGGGDVGHRVGILTFCKKKLSKSPPPGKKLWSKVWFTSLLFFVIGRSNDQNPHTLGTGHSQIRAGCPTPLPSSFTLISAY